MVETNTKDRPTYASRQTSMIVGYIFSTISLGMFIYVFLFEQDTGIRQQAIYWFVLSIASALLLSIQQMMYGDLELSYQ